MITSSVKYLPKSTVEIDISIPWNDIKSVYENVLKKAALNAEVPGFRKGKVPKKVLEAHIKKEKVYEEVIKDIIPKAYNEALTTHNLTPVISPKVEIVKAKENENWQVKVQVALKPKINLKNYKEKIKELKKSKVKIWTPGQEQKQEQEKKLAVNEIVKILLAVVEVELPDMLITQEANRLLADLVDQTRSVGMTIEQYLIAKNKTSDQLKQEYSNQAVANLTLEFTLTEIADTEKIVTTTQDIENLLSKIEKEQERERLRNDSYYLAHLIRQQKTLDFISNL